MKSKITPRVREQAASFCSAMAAFISSPELVPSPRHSEHFTVEAMIIGDLASNSACGQTMLEAWAEAEALLRTGWEP